MEVKYMNDFESLIRQNTRNQNTTLIESYITKLHNTETLQQIRKVYNEYTKDPIYVDKKLLEDEIESLEIYYLKNYEKSPIYDMIVLMTSFENDKGKVENQEKVIKMRELLSELIDGNRILYKLCLCLNIRTIERLYGYNLTDEIVSLINEGEIEMAYKKLKILLY